MQFIALEFKIFVFVLKFSRPKLQALPNILNLFFNFEQYWVEYFVLKTIFILKKRVCVNYYVNQWFPKWG